MNNNIQNENELKAQVEIHRLECEVSKLKQDLKQEIQEKERYLQELLETRNSKTYRIARGFTLLPRKLRGIKYVHGELGENQTLLPCMISVVIAVYNTAGFLSEMIESILDQKQDVLQTWLRSHGEGMYKQTVYDNIYEIILVDDGSSDGSEKICDEYAQKYSFIHVIHKENGGVSSARNAGLAVAKGKYVTFPDSDDKLSREVFEHCFLFFEAHEQEVSMVTYPLRFFDGQTGDHWTTYRFAQGNRILDMMNEWDKPQYFTAATLFKTASVRGKITFDSNLINGEDITFAHEVLFSDKPCIGLVSTCTYWYRRRSSGELSAVQQSKNTENYYIPYVTEMLGGLMRKAQDTYGMVPKYVQTAVMGQLQWRLRSDGDGELAKSVVGEEGFAEYRKLIKSLVRQLDLDVIMAQKQLFREHFFYLCSIRTGHEPHRTVEGENIRYSFEGFSCYDAAGCYLKLEFMEIKDGFLILEGMNSSLEPVFETWVKMNGVKIPVENDAGRDSDVKILSETALYTKAFHVHIPLESVSIGEIYFGTTVQNQDVIKTHVNLGKFMPISKNYTWSYYVKEDWAVQMKKNSLLVTRITSPERLIELEEDFEKQILRGKYGRDKEVQKAVSIRREAFDKSWRNPYRKISETDDKKIWLVSDRYSIADDNGEAMFRFLVEQEHPDIDVWFVIDPESKDYKRLSEIGKVVAQDSREHMVLHLLADYIISSQADEYIINPVWRRGAVGDVFRDFYCESKFVFLQHGVIKDDLSRWLNRFNKNIYGFICTAYKEAQSIREGDYYYNKQVWLTGLPRYDRLYHDERNYIVVMPTWRKWLMKDFNAALSDKDAVHVSDSITETDYFRFYHALLNHSALLDACDKYGFTLCFMPHTNLRECMDKFCEDKRVQLFDLDKKYRDVFAQANLLVTDYSSTAMDFAYLRKPVIYAQFDQERFFSGEHTYDKGYFDYEKDGFGEVVYDLDALVESIISYMQDGCIMKDLYRKRADGFFAYDDRNNCRRVYGKLLDRDE